MTKKICIIGVGYVGIQLACAFANKQIPVIAYDINQHKIDQYNQGIDITDTVKTIPQNIIFTNKINNISDIHTYIICVPTPVNGNNVPDISALKKATAQIGKWLKKNDLVIYESTVAPGTTVNICLPILEQMSNLKCGQDFYLAYSPERVSPNDNVLTEVTKLISGYDTTSLELIKTLYSAILPNKLYECDCIEIAEMSKIMENVKRDVNIALMNQFALLCGEQKINFYKVLQAAKTKFNFDNSNYTPGFVGGHCIGVDPYYILPLCNNNNNIIQCARDFNENIIQNIIQKIMPFIKNKNVTICGFSYKDNCNDIRNTKSYNLYQILANICNNVYIYDTNCDKQEVYDMYQITLNDTIPQNTNTLIIMNKDKSLLNLDLTKYTIIDLKNYFNENFIDMIATNNVNFDKTKLYTFGIDF